MVKALAQAFRWRKMLDEGVHGDVEDLAQAKGVHASYVSRVLRLTLLAPNLVDAMLDGRQPARLQLDELMEGFPLEWDGQGKFVAPRSRWQGVKAPTRAFRVAEDAGRARACDIGGFGPR
jgi:hypothetical protein